MKSTLFLMKANDCKWLATNVSENRFPEAVSTAFLEFSYIAFQSPIRTFDDWIRLFQWFVGVKWYVMVTAELPAECNPV